MKNLTKVKSQKGALSVEAAIVFPIFVCLISGIIMLLKLFFIQNVISEGMDNVYEQASKYSYSMVLFKEAFTDRPSEEDNSNRNFVEEKLSVIDDLILNPTAMILNKPLGEVVRYLIAQNGRTEKLITLGLKGGTNAINLDDSKILNDKKSVQIVAKYNVNVVIPPFFNIKVPFEQRRYFRVWALGNGKSLEFSKEDNIWDLPPMERGKKIQGMFGRNMATSNFKTITSYNKYSGEASSIKSIDLSSKTNQNPTVLKRNIKNMLNELDEFENQVKIKDDGKSYEVKSKKLVLIVPGDCRNTDNERIFNECKALANTKGMNFEVVNFGEKIGKKENK